VSSTDRKSILLTATKEATKDNIIFSSSAKKLMDERLVLLVTYV
jgi:hypothetical protein